MSWQRTSARGPGGWVGRSSESLPIELVREAFETAGQKLRTTRDGFRATCPAHGGSLGVVNVSATSDGTVLLKCHAGCDLSDLLGALELEASDLFPAETQGSRWGR